MSIRVRSKSLERAAESKPPCRSVSHSPDRIATPIALQPSGRQRRPRARIAVARASPSSRRIAGTPTNTSAIVPPTQIDRRQEMHDAESGQHAGRLSSLSMSADGILFLHLAGVLLFVGGSTAAAVLRLAATRRERPSEVALLLRAVRPAVPLVGGGLGIAIAAGFWLAHRLGFALSSGMADAHLRAARLDDRRRRRRRTPGQGDPRAG